ncbi:high-affinity hexose transporter [Paecilomyces variotii No. 5]|uniref:High-affinity hexose transporter n=1 Tax=Byssochlamys spectabilis (strain No. 5 / NBRC 109023) TaxID=1356009 RepID=V5FC41_BYSSN|nr:high-affinity hexose transporter [Paecilomyces variotii No. 5]
MTFFIVTFCCAFVALGSFLFGYDAGIISSTIAQKAFVQKFGTDSHLSDTVAGGIVSCFTGGAIIGSVVVSYISDAFGRRAAIFLGGLLATLGAALQGGCVTLAMLIAGRCIVGFAVGIMSATVPVYCTEVAPQHLRGLLGSMQQWMIGLGINVAQWVGYGSSLHSGDFSWRFPLSVQVIPSIIVCCGVWALPESPRWLIEHGRDKTGRAVLSRLHEDRAKSNEEYIEREYRQIKESIAVEQQTTVRSWRELLFNNTSWRRRVLLACGIQAFTQCSGTNVIQYYNPRIYAALGLSTSTSLMIIGIWGLLAVIWNTLFMLFMDRFGRRPLLIFSMIGMGAALCVEATLTHYFVPEHSEPTNASALRAIISMFFLFSFFFTPLGLISWIYPAEIFPTSIRARGAALGTFTNWSLNLVFAQSAPIGLTNLGYRFFYIFVAFNWVQAICVYLFYPETVAGSLEELGVIFEDGRERNNQDASQSCNGDRTVECHSGRRYGVLRRASNRALSLTDGGT